MRERERESWKETELKKIERERERIYIENELERKI